MYVVRVCGISVVRNEVDIMAASVAHHLSMGADLVLVLDNGSEDGTDEVLRTLAEGDDRVEWWRDDSPFDQAALTTRLAREAHRRGADWIVPFDADEFWYAEGGFESVLADKSDQTATLSVEVVNFVQARWRVESSPEGLLDMTWRPAKQWEPSAETRRLIEDHLISALEMRFLPKQVFRATPGIEVSRGAHRVAGTEGLREECHQIVRLHAPIRSMAVLEARADRKARLDAAGIPSDTRGGWRVGYWARVAEEGKMDREWAANSQEEGCLDVYGERRALTRDLRLRDVVAPHVGVSSRGDAP